MHACTRIHTHVSVRLFRPVESTSHHTKLSEHDCRNSKVRKKSRNSTVDCKARAQCLMELGQQTG